MVVHDTREPSGGLHEPVGGSEGWSGAENSAAGSGLRQFGVPRERGGAKADGGVGVGGGGGGEADGRMRYLKQTNHSPVPKDMCARGEEGKKIMDARGWLELCAALREDSPASRVGHPEPLGW